MDWVGGAGLVLGVIGIAVGIFGILDARRERSMREKSARKMHTLVGHIEGTLHTLKDQQNVSTSTFTVAKRGLQEIADFRGDLEKF